VKPGAPNVRGVSPKYRVLRGAKSNDNKSKTACAEGCNDNKSKTACAEGCNVGIKEEEQRTMQMQLKGAR
jgi:hypothetical protein